MAILALCYMATRPLAIGDPVAHAEAILAFERTAGLHIEPHLQAWSSNRPWLVGAMAWYYLPGHLVPFLGLLAWAAWRGGRHYAAFRQAALLAIGAAFALFVLFPVAPPRLVPSSGLADVTHATTAPGLDGGLVGALANPFAAFPSEHVAWAVLIAWAVVRFFGRRWAPVAAAHVGATVFLVFALGHHYVVDVAAGAGIGTLGAWAGERVLRREAAGPAREAAAQPF